MYVLIVLVNGFDGLLPTYAGDFNLTNCYINVVS